jgi:hypothetical protein
MPSVKGIVFESKACHFFPNARLKEQLEQKIKFDAYSKSTREDGFGQWLYADFLD